MKITKKRLKEIIKKELSQALSERQRIGHAAGKPRRIDAEEEWSTMHGGKHFPDSPAGAPGGHAFTHGGGVWQDWGGKFTIPTALYSRTRGGASGAHGARIVARVIRAELEKATEALDAMEEQIEEGTTVEGPDRRVYLSPDFFDTREVLHRALRKAIAML